MLRFDESCSVRRIVRPFGELGSAFALARIAFLKEACCLEEVVSTLLVGDASVRG